MAAIVGCHKRGAAFPQVHFPLNGARDAFVATLYMDGRFRVFSAAAMPQRRQTAFRPYRRSEGKRHAGDKPSPAMSASLPEASSGAILQSKPISDAISIWSGHRLLAELSRCNSITYVDIARCKR